MNEIERLEALLVVMNATQGEDSEYSRDVRLGIARIKDLEEAIRKLKGVDGDITHFQFIDAKRELYKVLKENDRS